MVEPSVKDISSILGFKKLKKIALNINKFHYSGSLALMGKNMIPNNVQEIEVIGGHDILGNLLIQAFDCGVFPSLEKLVIDPFDYYGRKYGK